VSAPQPPQVEPLDEDGVGAAAMGTILWAVALAVMIVLRDRLAASGAQWWIATAACGVGFGLLGLLYATRRRSAYRSARARAAEGSTS
jgi:hypothetical protein